jgi:protein tyrosine phosphatase (PTP) superfamily phosphohydrolase (DUF442 family)
MKCIKYSILFILLFELNFSVFSQQKISGIKPDIPQSPEEILVLDSTINLYQVGDFYITGQPGQAIFEKLKNQNLRLVINIRTTEEMDVLKKEGYDEAAFLDSIDIPYVHIPIGGNAGFTSTAIQEIDDAIKKYDQGKVMVHCRSAARATNAWMAWLINYDDIPVNDAIDMGRKMQFSFYLENLLGYELSFGKK